MVSTAGREVGRSIDEDDDELLTANLVSVPLDALIGPGAVPADVRSGGFIRELSRFFPLFLPDISLSLSPWLLLLTPRRDAGFGFA